MSPDDLIIISDLDEIPDPNKLKEIKQNNYHIDILAIEMDFYYYNLNCIIQNEKWYKARIINYGFLKIIIYRAMMFVWEMLNKCYKEVVGIYLISVTVNS